MEKIIEIGRKYGELVMRMAITHLVDKGRQSFENTDIDKACEKVISETPKNSLLSGEIQAKIIRCSKELSEVDIWDILKYVKTNLEIDGIYTLQGRVIRFLQNATGDYLATYMAPNGTTEEQIDDASQRLDILVDEYAKAHNDDCEDMDINELITRAFAENGVKLKPPSYHKTIYV